MGEANTAIQIQLAMNFQIAKCTESDKKAFGSRLWRSRHEAVRL